MTNLYNYLVQDHAARQHTMLISVGLGTLAGISTEVLGLPFHFAAGICIVTTGAVEIIRAFRYEPVFSKKRHTLVFPHSGRSLMFVPVSVALFLLVASVRPSSSILQRYTVSAALDTAASEAKAGSPETANYHVQKATEVLQKLTASRKPAPSSFFKSTANRLSQLAHQDSSGMAIHSALTQLADYSAAVAKSPGDARVSIGEMSRLGPFTYMRDAYIYGDKGLNTAPEGTVLDGFFLDNVTFENATIVYKGGSLRLQNVRFIHCRFVVSDSPQGRLFLLAAAQQPVNTQIIGKVE
jgi:hypothetical protein